MSSLGSVGRACPECGSLEFERGPGSTTGYWAGHVIGPIVCALCRYDVGYGILSSLPRFQPPVSQVEGGTSVGRAAFDPQPTLIDVRPHRSGRLFESRLARRVTGGIRSSAGSFRSDPQSAREWWVLILASLILAGILAALAASGGGGSSGPASSTRGSVHPNPSVALSRQEVRAEELASETEAKAQTPATASSLHTSKVLVQERVNAIVQLSLLWNHGYNSHTFIAGHPHGVSWALG